MTRLFNCCGGMVNDEEKLANNKEEANFFFMDCKARIQPRGIRSSYNRIAQLEQIPTLASGSRDRFLEVSATELHYFLPTALRLICAKEFRNYDVLMVLLMLLMLLLTRRAPRVWARPIS